MCEKNHTSKEDNKIYFVGAGSGAPDLITVRGKKLLEEADVIIYAGSLVNPELLSWAKNDCRMFNSAVMSLSEVLAVMKESWDRGERIVRLHTGDPSIFGAVREQMDALRQLHIPFEVCPGVSSFCGAAAALKAEYTLPDVSQTVIITRMEGRTAVPEKEKLSLLASHGASMVLFLSAGMAGRVREELLKGAYTDNTPCAIVYKATWPEEKIIRGTLGELPELAQKHHITKTALIVVGDFLGDDYSLSKLYDDNFTTQYRKAGIPWQLQGKDLEPDAGKDFWPDAGKDLAPDAGKVSCPGSIGILSFTEEGKKINRKVGNYFRSRGFTVWEGIYGSKAFSEAHTETPRQFVEEYFSKADLLFFVGACGIAVRLLAPYIKDKRTDPAVVVSDEKGEYVISLLSGHLGGANDWAREIASVLGGKAVITTATDVAKRFAPDLFAKKYHLTIQNMEEAKMVAAAGLTRNVLVFCEHTWKQPPALESGAQFLTKLPDDAKSDRDFGEMPGVLISNRETPEKIFSPQCHLIPRNLTVGIGCRKGKEGEEIYHFLLHELEENHLSPSAVWKIASIDVKKEEKGILYAAERLGVPFETFSAEELQKIPGEFTFSEFVREAVGVDNVCERSAVAAAQSPGGRFLLRKTAEHGITLAIYERAKLF